jgi:hypothetical protein
MFITAHYVYRSTKTLSKIFTRECVRRRTAKQTKEALLEMQRLFVKQLLKTLFQMVDEALSQVLELLVKMSPETNHTHYPN